ncbi:dTDP-4-dehydrorhamnose 3,5-epimerase [Vibrio owensii]
MKVIDTRIPDVKIIEPTVFNDERGFFMESWNQKDFEKIVTQKPTKFVQDNHSKSKINTLRGLHYQTENTQGKLVRVISGEVYDVALDIRLGSPTFGLCIGVLLTEANKRQLWIPEGFAHGFYVLSPEAEFVYKCTDYYNPKAEISIKWNSIDFAWPFNDEPSLSEKDRNGIDFSMIDPKLLKTY